MIEYARYCQIKELAAQGFSDAKIAAHTGLNEKTVRKWRRRPSYHQRRGAPRESKLDPFKPTVARWLAEADFTVVQVYQRLLKEGYGGGRSIVGDYIRSVRPKTHRAYRTLHFEPGEAAQVDWGAYGSLQVGTARRRLSFLCVVLCSSRMMYVEAFVQERIEHVLGGLDNAFAYFGGVPRALIVDNMKTAVTEHRPGCPPKFNARFLDFCGHFGTSPRACTPRAAWEKGRVEAGVGYVKGSFFNGRDLGGLPAGRPLESLNALLRLWMEETANVRQHRETGRRPLDLSGAERAAMLPLNPNPCDTGQTVTARVTNRCRVHCDGNRYSVPPAYSQKQVHLHRSYDRLCLYYQGRLIARHARCYERGRQIVDPEHEAALIEQQGRGLAARDVLAFESMGPLAAVWLANLQRHHPNHLHHVRRVLRMRDLHGEETVLRALEESGRFGVYTWPAVGHLIECWQRAAGRPAPAAMAPTASSRALLEIRLPRPDLSHYPGGAAPGAEAGAGPAP